ncbi:MAG: sugar ABC transporter ATP-binding protein, partial [Victivallaceae bacterium]
YHRVDCEVAAMRLDVNKQDKSYATVQVLFDLNFSVAPGEILGLIGENGAGKSTLIKCLSGQEPIRRGEIRLDGETVSFPNRAAAIAAGVTTVPQEFNLVDTLTVAENLFLGREKRRMGLLDRRAMRERTREVLAELHSELDPDRLVATLSVADKQLLEIAKALESSCRLLILDEPTTVLNADETAILFGLLRKLAKQRISILFVSHKLHEIKELCDTVAVMRDGHLVAAGPIADYTAEIMARQMVGRDLKQKFPPKRRIGQEAPVLLEVDKLSLPGKLEDISFRLRSGEILGVAGLAGSGRSELLETLYGLRRRSAGRVKLVGQETDFRTARQALDAGVMLLPEDRQGAGVLLDSSVTVNIAALKKGALIDPAQEKLEAEEFIRKFSIRPPFPDAIVRRLSGGNQQKVAIARNLVLSPVLFLLDEPTRGVDVGARSDLYDWISHLAGGGIGCILVSSDLEELIGMCDRVLVLRSGRLAGEVAGEQVNEEEIMYYATGVKEHGEA